ncbi:Serine/arginine-rich splicing factor RS40-like protein [Drosera capensis]
MRPIFCGNFEFDARESDLERLFRRYGKVERVDMKSGHNLEDESLHWQNGFLYYVLVGFAFIYMDDERDAEYAIRALDGTEFGRKGRRLRVEWTKERGGPRRPPSSRRSANLRPSKTLFVINFPFDTRVRDLERHFEPYGKLVNVRIRKNFAFVQFESQKDATKALHATNHSKMIDKVISVEYAAGDGDDDKRNGYSPDRRVRDRSPDRRRRSPSPYGRERGSPDYGRGPSPAPYRTERGSPDYHRDPSLSPRKKGRNSHDYGDTKARDSSPNGKDRAIPNYRDRSRSPRRESRSSPDFPKRRQSSPREHISSPHFPKHSQRSPGERRGSPDYFDHNQNRSRSLSRSRSPPLRETRTSTEYPVRDQSPHEAGRDSRKYHDGSISPRSEPKASPDYNDRMGSPEQEKSVENGYNGDHPGTSYYRDEGSPYSDRGVAPDTKPDSRDSPEYEEDRD